jgi:DNA-binding transcriptional regulator YiaG
MFVRLPLAHVRTNDPALLQPIRQRLEVSTMAFARLLRDNLLRQPSSGGQVFA